MISRFIRRQVFVSILSVLCVGQENVHIPIFRGPSGWHVNVSVDYHHAVSPVLSFLRTSFFLDIPRSNGPRMISLFPENDHENDIAGRGESSVDFFNENLSTLETSRTAEISHLAINYDSRFFRQLGPIAITNNPIDSTSGDLILRSTHEEFVASCQVNSIVSLQRNARGHVRARLYVGEDEDLLLGVSEFFYLGDSQILSIPETGFRRYIEKMVELGAVEPPSTDSGSNTASRSVLMNNCTTDLVAQLPPIRIYFEQTDNPYIELSGDDLIFVDQGTRTCRLALGARPGSRIVFSPSHVPFMNFRIGLENDLHFCDTTFSQASQSHSERRPVRTDAHTPQVTEELFPLVFSAHGGHVMVQVDNNGSALVDMILSEADVTRVFPEDVVSNSESFRSSAFSLHGIPSERIVFESLSSSEAPRSRSVLAIGHGSWILNQFGSVAVIRNAQNSTLGSLSLGSSSRTFATSCVPGSLNTQRSCVPGSLNTQRNDPLAVDERRSLLNLGTSERFTALTRQYIEFRFGTMRYSPAVALVYPDLFTEINRFLTELGATIDTNQQVRTTTLFRNCTSDMVSRLPTMELRFYRGGPTIELHASEYVTRDDVSNTCHVLLEADNQSVWGPNWFTLFPFRIPSLNTRISKDGYMQVCRNAVSTPAFGVENIVGPSPTTLGYGRDSESAVASPIPTHE